MENCFQSQAISLGRHFWDRLQRQVAAAHHSDWRQATCAGKDMSFGEEAEARLNADLRKVSGLAK